MSGGHWQYSGFRIQSDLLAVAEDHDVVKRWPLVGAAIKSFADWFYQVEHDMDYDLSGDTPELAEPFDIERFGKLLDDLLKIAPEPWRRGLLWHHPGPAPRRHRLHPRLDAEQSWRVGRRHARPRAPVERLPGKRKGEEGETMKLTLFRDEVKEAVAITLDDVPYGSYSDAWPGTSGDIDVRNVTDSHLLAIYDTLTPVVNGILLARGHEDLIRHPHGAACNCPCRRGAATPCLDDNCPLTSHLLYHDELETKQ